MGNKNHIFTCHRQADIIRFLELLDSKGGTLCGINRTGEGFLSFGYDISYMHTEELNMEVWC